MSGVSAPLDGDYPCLKQGKKVCLRRSDLLHVGQVWNKNVTEKANYIVTEDVKVDDRFLTHTYEEREKKRKEIVHGWPLIYYATINLFVHGEKASSYRGGDLLEQVRLLEQVIASWTRVYQLFDEYSSKCPHLNTTILHAAAGANLIDVVEHLIRNNLDVNIQDEEGYTALHLAARWGHQPVTKSLFHAGASIGVKTKQEQTPLVLAAGNRHSELVRWLLEQGACVNEATGDSGSALQAAAKDGNAMMVMILLDAGADVNARGGEYDNTLQAASERGHEKVVQMLVIAGANVNAQMQGNDLGQLSCGEFSDGADSQFNLNFRDLENADVLENFDFDSFLNTSADDAFNIDIGGDFGDFGIGQDQ